MGRPVSFDFTTGGGSPEEFLMGTVHLEPTLMHTIGNTVVLPDAPYPVKLVNGKAVHPNVAVSPAGPEPTWAYKVTIENELTGKAWSEFRGVPTGTTQIAYKELPKFVTTIPPHTTAGMMQNWADTAQDGASRAETAADRAEAPTDLMNKNLIEDTASLTNAALSAAIAHSTVRAQANLYAAYTKKLRTGAPVKITIQGDSTVYGHDTVSADKVAPAPGHVQTRSPWPFPEKLAVLMSEVYPAGVTVENRGFSGDTVGMGFTRWSAPSGSDITWFSYGINDAVASWGEAPGDVGVYLNNYEKMIRREIKRGSAVGILLSTKQSSTAGNTLIDVFREGARVLAEKLGIPVVDLEPFLSGYGNGVYSDTTHLNTAGNAIIAARLAAAFTGVGPHAPKMVGDGTRLGVHPTMDNLVLGPNTSFILSDGIKGTPPEDSADAAGTGLRTITGQLGRAYWSFYTDAPDTIVIPQYQLNGTSSVTWTLDHGIPQPDNVLDTLVGEPDSWTRRAANSFTDSGTVTGTMRTGIPDQGRAIRIVSPGWHTLKFEGTASSFGVYLFALEFISYRTLAATKKNSAFYLPVPPSFNQSTPINSTRVAWLSVFDRLQMEDWGVETYKAPPLKVTVRSYGQRVIEYVLVCTAGKETGSGIEMIKEIRNTQVAAVVNEEYVREIDTVTFDSTTRELVFTWKTAGKVMTQNFTMTISAL